MPGTPPPSPPRVSLRRVRPALASSVHIIFKRAASVAKSTVFRAQTPHRSGARRILSAGRNRRATTPKPKVRWPNTGLSRFYVPFEIQITMWTKKTCVINFNVFRIPLRYTSYSSYTSPMTSVFASSLTYYTPSPQFLFHGYLIDQLFGIIRLLSTRPRTVSVHSHSSSPLCSSYSS